MKKVMDGAGNLTIDKTGSAVITSSPSVKDKAPVGGAGLFFGPLGVQVLPGATDGTCTTTAPGVGSISPSATKVKDGSGQLAVLDGDNVTIAGIPGVLSGGGACTLTVKVTANASQAKVLAL